MVTLKNKRTRKTFADMKDGDIAVIVNNSKSHYNGRIVQRYDRDDQVFFVCLGEPSGKSWPNFISDIPSIEVEILEKGSLLEIV